MALIEDPQSGGQYRILAIVRRVAALDADQRRDHRVPPPDRVRQQLACQLRVLAVPELGGGALGEVDVEHVQVAAAAAEPDHLTVQGGDQIDVVGLQITQDQRQHPEPRQASAIRRMQLDLPNPCSPITNAVGAVSRPAR